MSQASVDQMVVGPEKTSSFYFFLKHLICLIFFSPYFCANASHFRVSYVEA